MASTLKESFWLLLMENPGLTLSEDVQKVYIMYLFAIILWRQYFGNDLEESPVTGHIGRYSSSLRSCTHHCLHMLITINTYLYVYTDACTCTYFYNRVHRCTFSFSLFNVWHFSSIWHLKNFYNGINIFADKTAKRCCRKVFDLLSFQLHQFIFWIWSSTGRN